MGTCRSASLPAVIEWLCDLQGQKGSPGFHPAMLGRCGTENMTFLFGGGGGGVRRQGGDGDGGRNGPVWAEIGTHLRRGLLLVDPTRRKRRIRLRGGISGLTPDKPMAARQYFSSMSQANIAKLFSSFLGAPYFGMAGEGRHSWGKGWVAVEIGGAGGFEERDNGWMDAGGARLISMVSISVPCENSLGRAGVKPRN